MVLLPELCLYVRAENAANDINDPNARASLQQEIRNFVDAIQKIGSDTEYNGIKLLDGSFTDKYIHYGPRMSQTVRLSVDSLKARDLGAYMIVGTGGTESGANAITSLTSHTFVQKASSINVTVGGRVINAGFEINGASGTSVVDVGRLAYEINQGLYDIDFEAKAVNVSVANEYHAIANVNASATLTFQVGKVGSASTVKFSFTVNTTVTLDELVEKINREAATAGAPLAARADNGRLVLETEHGETIALQVDLASAATVNMDQLIQGASSTNGKTVSAIKVGDLYIARPEDMGNASTDISLTSIVNSTNSPITFSIGSATDDEFKDLYAIDVRSNEGAETALMITKVALQKVDTVRAQIGATINNLQSIFDAQKVAYDNTKQAESVIRNTDYAKEMAEFTTYQIRMQSTIAMLAQANSLPQLVLQLLR
jgi:flagellin